MIQPHVLTPEALTTVDIDQMHRLMVQCYENVDRADFEKDLQRKDHVLVLRNDQDLCGFSTQALWSHCVDGGEVRIVYSGDTVVADNARLSFALPLAFGNFLRDMHARDPKRPLYWLLTSKGFRTYRAMTVFFRNSFPAANRVLSPFEEKLLETLLDERFPGRLDRETWVLKAGAGSQALKRKADFVESSNRSHSDIKRFAQLNPDYVSGDELVCLARFERANVKPSLWKRMFGP